jgi:hypothetical protein
MNPTPLLPGITRRDAGRVMLLTGVTLPVAARAQAGIVGQPDSLRHARQR